MRVLLLEDDVDLARELVGALRRSGFAVDHVATLADADEAIALAPYDCLVLDRSLPDGDALSVVEDLRRRGTETGILVLTARDTVVDRVAGFHAGADDYLVKPFAFAELEVRIRAVARRGTRERTPVLRSGDVELDVPRHEVTRGGVLLSLGPKEFAVLEMLLDARGDVLSRTALFEGCWDERTDPMSNVVDAVVAQLRRRLGAPDPIETVRGVGYRIRT
ncbi:response regulator transcription factor [Curtobacterium sp. 9128]|uniref:winged helix-turn-helix domain-containing protein n=1 Tax=Curtobacterium sp. 9128 TaxID=1793722 RepID=UPI00119DD933|nr:response regulator transcription factor [Curtobacterium sp. 9128]